MNADELRQRLGGISPKSLLAAVLVIGFLATVPAWMGSNSEDQQHLAQTAVRQMVEKNVGLLDILPKEKKGLRQMLEPLPEPAKTDFEQTVWVKDIVGTIRPWVGDEQEATTIARWVYVYARKSRLSPELILGVIAVESQFDHFAVSNVGAVGLMQVMPFWKKELGKPDDNLLNIETNIRYGCAIIRHYVDRYKTLDRALAAYNGSLGRTKYPDLVFAKMKKFHAIEGGLAAEADSSP
ncbi:lytic transglycosylase domain-containing protein [Mariprofundus ferrooxydans]|uniref:Soluble lytic murein transglycosylase and related regulatory protein (Some contain LysM/invasin domains) n=1 Tax=Mariprofundus ferrooxydans PV-1 TaxID=314345 RepID=Q0EYY1_9PROT|nr:lytic transglycosylase domain-containing protein [Mariprofundus ferrooxydans]EAU54426.1 Soluble lytic murein transglycosylase and related regulatory protein (some contain LysM/invasin domains) [Mariprofundus ferrooxydans PV-1]KON48356.1 lytic murein transglycosylase [Mariprofundus ferrooxydans]